MKTIAWLVIALFSSPVLAQELPSAAVLETQAGTGVEPGTDGAVDRMVRARLDGLNVVRTSSGVALDLAEVQLALGCVGETAECLAPVANELSVQLLLIPALDQTDGDLMLTITLFDREASTLRRVVRQASGENARAELLDAVDGQLRELFGLPAVPVEEEGHENGGPVAPPTSNELSPGPFVLMGLGAVALGVGIGLGVAFLDEQDAYAMLMGTSKQELDEAFSRAETLAIAADVLMIGGGAIAVAGLIWLVVDLTDGVSSAETTRLTPLIGPSFAGLAVQGDWGTR